MAGGSAAAFSGMAGCRGAGHADDLGLCLSPARIHVQGACGIMWVIFDHLRPSGHIMPDHAGDRGAALMVFVPHDHLHIKQIRMFTAPAVVHKYPDS